MLLHCIPSLLHEDSGFFFVCICTRKLSVNFNCLLFVAVHVAFEKKSFNLAAVVHGVLNQKQVILILG